MEAEQQYQTLQHHPRPFLHQEFIPASSSSFLPDTSRFVQSINNRACVLVTMGKFAKANGLLEIALTKHRQMAAMRNRASTSTGENASFEPLCTRTSSGSVMSDYPMDLADIDNSESSFDEDDDDDFFLHMDSSDCHCGQQHERKPTDDVSSSTSHIPSPSSQACDGTHPDFLPSQTPNFLRMSTCSRLQTFSYSGQQVDRSPSKWMHHQIYRLPIVMNENEWDDSPMEDQSFVLIFNAALCNHLMGMHMMLRHQHRHPNQCTNCKKDQEHYLETLQVAKMLYSLALEAFAQGHPEAGVRGIDRLCYPAVFNNISHVCKTLDGYGSHDAYKYDTLLLKSVYWLIDSTSPNHRSTPNHSPGSSMNGEVPSTASVGASSPATEQNIQSDDDFYDDDFTEIIDAFLENVFYLIGAPESIVPAAAA